MSTFLEIGCNADCFCWLPLVSIYTKCGNFKDAFDNFNFMQEAGVEPGNATSSVSGRRKTSSCTDPKIQIWLRCMAAKCAHCQMQQSQGGFLKGFMVCEKCECTLSKVRELMDMFHQCNENLLCWTGSLTFAIGGRHVSLRGRQGL
jgi:pentatricopeptide repeat protein